jgi:hypothetical protein
LAKNLAIAVLILGNADQEFWGKASAGQLVVNQADWGGLRVGEALYRKPKTQPIEIDEGNQ